MLQDASDAAKVLQTEVWAVIINPEESEEAWEVQVGSYGADVLIQVEAGEIPYWTAEVQALLLDQLSKSVGIPHLVILSGSVVGQETAARLAIKWDTAYVHKCVQFSIHSNGMVEAARSTHRGNQETIVSIRTVPAIVSFLPGSAGVGAKMKDRIAEKRVYSESLATAQLEQHFCNMIPADPATIDIREADFILACGHGVGDDETFEILQELAKRLGASVAGTRRANDKGWIGMERRIGLTGKTVSPQVYMAIGISGAREHVVGMEESKTIIAVNTDARAEIFRIAHKGAVGDAREVILSLLERLRSDQA